MNATPIDAVDRRIVVATQGGLEMVSRPYAAVARHVGIPEAEVIKRLKRMLADGVIRRIGAVPNHYALGYSANAMTVWDVADERIEALGTKVGALDFVSHCYHRPRHPPEWPYNLFAMVHGRDRPAVEHHIDALSRLLATDVRGHQVLYSTRILKKTGLRLVA
jgi:siroheme decarboxylase